MKSAEFAEASRAEEGRAGDFAFYRRRYGSSVLVALAMARAVAVLVWFATALNYHWDLSFPEGAIVARAAAVARGEAAYADWREWPHQFAPYGPLTYYPVGLIARTGEVNDPQKIYVMGRAVSLVCILGIALLAGMMARRMGMGTWWCAVAAAATFFWDDLSTYTLSFRPDAPQVFFSLLALWIATGGKANAPRVLVVLALIAISFWFKPFAFGTLAAILFWIGRSAGWKRCLIWGAAFFAVNGLHVLAMNVAMDGRLLLNMVGSLDNGIEIYNWTQLTRWMPMIAAFALVAGIFAAAANMRNADRDSPLFLTSMAALLSAIVAGAAYFKTGADINYLYETYVLCTVLTIRALHSWWTAERAVAWREAVLVAGVCPLVIVSVVLQLMTARADVQANLESDEPLPISRRVAAEASVLTTFPYLALQSRGEPAIMDYLQYNILAARGRIDPAPLLARVRRGEFNAIVLNEHPMAIEEGYFAPGFLDAVKEAYAVEARFGPMAVLKPRHATE